MEERQGRARGGNRSMGTVGAGWMHGAGLNELNTLGVAHAPNKHQKAGRPEEEW